MRTKREIIYIPIIFDWTAKIGEFLIIIGYSLTTTRWGDRMTLTYPNPDHRISYTRSFRKPSELKWDIICVRINRNELLVITVSDHNSLSHSLSTYLNLSYSLRLLRSSAIPSTIISHFGWPTQNVYVTCCITPAVLAALFKSN